MGPPSQLRQRFKWTQAGGALVLLICVIALALYLNSGAFRNRVREAVVFQLERITGGRVELKSFTWHLSNLVFDIDGLTIHGLEKPGDVPYAQVQHAHVRLTVISLLGGQIGLRDLQID